MILNPLTLNIFPKLPGQCKFSETSQFWIRNVQEYLKCQQFSKKCLLKFDLIGEEKAFFPGLLVVGGTSLGPTSEVKIFTFLKKIVQGISVRSDMCCSIYVLALTGAFMPLYSFELSRL